MTDFFRLLPNEIIVVFLDYLAVIEYERLNGRSAFAQGFCYLVHSSKMQTLTSQFTVATFTDISRCFVLSIVSDDSKLIRKLDSSLSVFGLSPTTGQVKLPTMKELDVDVSKHYDQLDEVYTPMGRMTIDLNKLDLNPKSHQSVNFLSSVSLLGKEIGGNYLKKHVECVLQVLGEIADIIGVQNPSYDMFSMVDDKTIFTESNMSKNGLTYKFVAVNVCFVL